MTHKHADVVRAFLDGKAIQWYSEYENLWRDLDKIQHNLVFYYETKYRVKQAHQDLIDAQADGKVIQYLSKFDGGWGDLLVPLTGDENFDEDYEYRVKPREIVVERWVEHYNGGPIHFRHFRDDGLQANIRYTFDADTSELLKVEKI